MGQVEVDETYIGGKNRNRHWDKKQPGTGTAGKIPVVGAISRKGNVICKMIENADTETLTKFVRKTVSDKVELVATDEASGYRYLKYAPYPHYTVSHSDGEYVRGEIHTQNIDSFWALLKRGIIGTYHNVSKKYQPFVFERISVSVQSSQRPRHFLERTRRMLRRPNWRTLLHHASSPKQMEFGFMRRQRWLNAQKRR